MRNSFTKPRIKKEFLDLQDIQNKIAETEAVQFYVCPFEIVLGAINTTEAGYKTLNAIPTDYTTFSKVFTGKESILAIWRNSYTTSTVKDETDPWNDSKNYALKTFKTGDVFQGILTTNQIGVSFNPASQNNAFVGEEIIKNVMMRFKYDTNKELFENIVDYSLMLWQIPELNTIRPAGKSIYDNSDKQYYFINSAVTIYHNKTKLPSFIEINFLSLNDRLAKSGVAINQYVQLSNPGGKYCIPKVGTDKKITFQCLQTPITHAQISYYGFAGQNNISFYGRPIYKNDDLTNNLEKIYAPRLIFPYEFQTPTYDEISQNGLPSTNFYVATGYQSVLDSYQEWKQAIASSYDDNATKHFEGHLRPSSNVSDTTDTNPPDAQKNRIAAWDTSFLAGDLKTWQKTINVAGSQFFIVNPSAMDESQTKQSLGLANFDWSTIPSTSHNLPNWNMFSYFCYAALWQVPLTTTQTTQIALSSIPIIGSFFSFLTAGMNLGFKSLSSQDIPKFPIQEFLIDCEIYDSYNNTLFSTFSELTAKGILPLDVFRANSADSLGELIGTHSIMTSYCFNLTDQVNIQPTKIDDGTLLQSEQITASKLGQFNYPKPFTSMYLVNETTNLAPKPNDPNSDTFIQGYSVDSYQFQTLFKGNYKLNFYSIPYNWGGNVNNESCTWMGTCQTLANFNNNTRNWTNRNIMSNPLVDFKDKFKYPQKIINPTPSGTIPTYAIPNITFSINLSAEGLVKDPLIARGWQFLLHANKIVQFKLGTAPIYSGYEVDYITFNLAKGEYVITECLGYINYILQPGGFPVTLNQRIIMSETNGLDNVKLLNEKVNFNNGFIKNALPPNPFYLEYGKITDISLQDRIKYEPSPYIIWDPTTRFINISLGDELLNSVKTIMYLDFVDGCFPMEEKWSFKGTATLSLNDIIVHYRKTSQEGGGG